MTDTTTVIRCPACSAEFTETMPADACVYFWICPGCAAVATPKAGHCCVFCSYGLTPCVPRSRAIQGLKDAAKAKDAVLELREFLLFSGDLSGPEFALGLDQRLDAITALPGLEQYSIGAKLVALREWVNVLGSPAELEEHGGPATVRSLLLADCGVMYCYLTGPPDEMGVEGEMHSEHSSGAA